MSAPVNIDIPKLILDNGGGLIKGGILPSYSQLNDALFDEIEPKFIVPNCVGQIRKKNIFHISDSCYSICEYFCHRPHVDGLLLDLEMQTKIWEKIFSCKQTIGYKINDMAICITESYLTPAYIRQGVIELLFEYFNFDQIVIVSSQTMLPFSYIGLNLGQYDILNPPIFNNDSYVIKKKYITKRRRTGEKTNKPNVPKRSLTPRNSAKEEEEQQEQQMKEQHEEEVEEEEEDYLGMDTNSGRGYNLLKMESKKSMEGTNEWEAMDEMNKSELNGYEVEREASRETSREKTRRGNSQMSREISCEGNKRGNDQMRYETSYDMSYDTSECNGEENKMVQYNDNSQNINNSVLTNRHIFIKNIECYNKYTYKVYMNKMYHGENWQEYYFNSFFNMNSVHNSEQSNTLNSFVNNVYSDRSKIIKGGTYLPISNNKINIVKRLCSNNYIGNNFLNQDPNFLLPDKIDLYRTYYDINFKDINMFKEYYNNNYINN
ncbi:actin-related protein, putative (ARP6), partial [Plasmodium malariae]